MALFRFFCASLLAFSASGQITSIIVGAPVPCDSLDEGAGDLIFTVDEEPNGLMTARWLADRKMGLEANITNWVTRSTEVIAANRRYAGDRLVMAQNRFQAALDAYALGLKDRMERVETRWHQLAVASRHYRLGKCCCTSSINSEEETRCHWEAFAQPASHDDRSCQQGMDYLDKIPAEVSSVQSLSTTLDSFLSKCAASRCWKNQLEGKKCENQESIVRPLERNVWPGSSDLATNFRSKQNHLLQALGLPLIQPQEASAVVRAAPQVSIKVTVSTGKLTGTTTQEPCGETADQTAAGQPKVGVEVNGMMAPM